MEQSKTAQSPFEDKKSQDIPSVLFVTGIGTDVGKSYVTGWLAREMNRNGISCVTQKMIQTGNIGQSEDILRHREIMGCGMLPEDESHLTAPVIFTYPASPHLAAEIDGMEIPLDKIAEATAELQNRYGHVIVEGAGGLMVPIKGDYLTLDYITERKLPVVVGVTGQLGSINHALLTFKVLADYGIPIFAVVYNPYFDEDETICADTRKYLRDWLSRHNPGTQWLEMPVL